MNPEFNFPNYLTAHQLGASMKPCMKMCFGDDYAAEPDDNTKDCFSKCTPPF